MERDRIEDLQSDEGLRELDLTEIEAVSGGAVLVFCDMDISINGDG